MANVLENPTELAAAHDDAPDAPPAPVDKNFLTDQTTFSSWFLSTDHKRIGLMYLASLAIVFAMGVFFALVLELEHLTVRRHFMTAHQYNQTFTWHGVVMVFLFLLPAIPSTLGTFVLPLQLGARQLAFPKLARASLYLYWIGVAIAFISLSFGSLETGWTFPLAGPAGRMIAVRWLATGVLCVALSNAFVAANIVVSTHTLRAPGLSWMRLPVSVWTLYAASLVQLLVIPVLLAALALLSADHSLSLGLFDAQKGGSPMLLSHLFWFYAQPALTVMLAPAIGIGCELLAVHAKSRVFGYASTVLATFAFVLLSCATWGQHLFSAGQSDVANALFSAFALLSAVPLLTMLANAILTLSNGVARMTTPMLFALFFLFQLAVAALSGLFLAVPTLHAHLANTYFVVAYLHYVTLGTIGTAILGGLHHWWPKLVGKAYNPRLAVLAAFLFFTGFQLAFFPAFIMGTRSAVARTFESPDQFHWLHTLSSTGAIVVAGSLVMMFLNFMGSLFNEERIVNNPWGARTLEWQTPCPPATTNFATPPVVSGDPYDFSASNSQGDTHAS